jgi:hypothetical protein
MADLDCRPFLRRENKPRSIVLMQPETEVGPESPGFTEIENPVRDGVEIRHIHAYLV